VEHTRIGLTLARPGPGADKASLSSWLKSTDRGRETGEEGSWRLPKGVAESVAEPARVACAPQNRLDPRGARDVDSYPLESVQGWHQLRMLKSSFCCGHPGITSDRA
jgi:hypothetical protein